MEPLYQDLMNPPVPRPNEPPTPTPVTCPTPSPCPDCSVDPLKNYIRARNWRSQVERIQSFNAIIVNKRNKSDIFMTGLMAIAVATDNGTTCQGASPGDPEANKIYKTLSNCSDAVNASCQCQDLPPRLTECSSSLSNVAQTLSVSFLCQMIFKYLVRSDTRPVDVNGAHTTICRE